MQEGKACSSNQAHSKAQAAAQIRTRHTHRNNGSPSAVQTADMHAAWLEHRQHLLETALNKALPCLNRSMPAFTRPPMSRLFISAFQSASMAFALVANSDSEICAGSIRRLMSSPSRLAPGLCVCLWQYKAAC